MANTTQYEELIEADVVTRLKAATAYTIDRFYNTYSPAALYEEAKGKLSAVNGTVLIHWQETEFEGLSTDNKVYQSTPRIELLCLWPAAKESQLPGSKRTVHEVVANVCNALINHTVTIDSQTYEYYLRRKQNLFRDTNMDAILVTLELQTNVTEF